MKTYWVGLVFFIYGIGSGFGQTNVVITSFDGASGQLVFSEVDGATNYYAEKSTSPSAGTWTNVGGALDTIAPSGAGSVTCSIPVGIESSCFYRIVSEMEPTPSTPNGMVVISAGSFQMGDTFNEGRSYELPVHTVYVDGFYMDQYEVTNDKMVEVLQWAYDQGKLIVSSSTVKNKQGSRRELLDLDASECRITWDGSTFDMKSAKGSGYPCVEVTWFGAVAYCNYRSLMDGLTQVYNFTYWSCDWNANGYRLPTEAEWETAARGGLSGRRFPSGNTISHNAANYYSNNGYSYDTSTTSGYHPLYNDGVYPYTSPVGSFAPNGYGLYDMAGNVQEWCWDWQDEDYYATSPPSNPHGPATGFNRIKRGGLWASETYDSRSSSRSWQGAEYTSSSSGFRSVMSVE